MANYLSTPQTFQPPIATYSFDIIGKALQYKQQAADVNQAKVQAEIDKYTQVDLARDVDKQYLAGRLNTLVSHINSLEGADMSSQNVTNILQGHISQAIDDNIITAAASTKNLRTLQSDIDNVKTKSPDKYNPLNEAFSMRGAQAWLANPEVGAAYSGGVYNPYEDVNKSMLGIVKDLKDTKGDQVIEVPVRDQNGNLTGRIQRKTIKGLTPEEIQAYLPNLLPPSTLQQLQINGWGKYQGSGGLQAAQDNFTEYTKQINAQLDQDISTSKTGEASTAISKEDRQNYAKQRQALMQKKENFNAQMTNVNQQDTASLGAFLETNQWLNNFSQIAGAKESTEWESDTAFYDQKNLELSYAREARLTQESQLGMAKTALEIQKLQGELTATSAGDVSLSPTVGELPSEIDPLKDSQTRYSQLATTVNQIAGTVYTQANEDQKKLFDAEKKKLLQQGQTESNANKIAFDKIFGQSNPNEYGYLIDIQAEKNTIARGIKLAKDEANIEDFAQNGDKYFRTLSGMARSNPEVAQYIQQNGVSAAALRDTNNRELITKTAEYLEEISEKQTEALRQQYETTTDPQVRQSLGYTLRSRTSPDTSVRNKTRVNEILASKGYTGFTTASTANISSETDRKVIKNSLPQTEGGFQFDEKQPMTVLKNPDGSLTVQQIKEGMSGGVITSNPRSAVVAKGSDLYNYLNSKIQLSAEKQTRLNSYTPTRKPLRVRYIDPNASDIVKESADYVLASTGNRPMTTSGASPVNYLTPTGTKEVYKSLARVIPQQKLDVLTGLMAANTNKFDVRADVEKGQWKVSTTLKGATPILISRDLGGTEQNNKQINLFVEQFPQITVGESVYKYLLNSPEQIDNIIQTLSE